MLKKLEDTIGSTCLIGLTYFNIDGEQLKQTLLAGKVTSVDAEMGITLSLMGQEKAKSSSDKSADFILPANLSCWFNAPEGEFHTSQAQVKITNPDFLVTWDIHQTKPQKVKSGSEAHKKEKNKDGEHQWWEWVPRTTDPSVNK